jgi:hypothetical protein
MVWEKSITDNTYLMKDYSKFDDGSVDETASFYIDLDSMKPSQVETDMAFPNGGFNLNFAFNNQNITGKYIINRDSSERTIDIDTTFNYDIVRGEIYMMLHTLDISKKSKTNFNTFVSTSVTVANSSLEVLGSKK